MKAFIQDFFACFFVALLWITFSRYFERPTTKQWSFGLSLFSSSDALTVTALQVAYLRWGMITALFGFKNFTILAADSPSLSLSLSAGWNGNFLTYKLYKYTISNQNPKSNLNRWKHKKKTIKLELMGTTGKPFPKSNLKSLKNTIGFVILLYNLYHIFRFFNIHIPWCSTNHPNASSWINATHNYKHQTEINPHPQKLPNNYQW